MTVDKRNKVNLRDDFSHLSDHFKDLAEQMRNNKVIHIDKINNYMEIVHDLKMLCLISCMDKLFDRFNDTQSAVKELKFLLETWKELTRRDSCSITYNNGFFINRSMISSRRMWFDSRQFTDHEEFELSVQAIVNEKAGAPP